MFLAGCSISPVSDQTTYYTLEPVAVTKYHRHNYVLAIELPKTEPGLQSNAILYSKQEFSLSSYVNSKWSVAPNILLHNLLIESFSKSAMFNSVISGSYTKNAKWKVKLRVLHWYQNFLVTPSEVVVSYIIDLYDLEHNKLIASKLFETIEPCSAENAYGGIVAYNKAMEYLIPATLSFVHRHI